MGAIFRPCLFFALALSAASARAADERYYSMVIDGRRVGYSHYIIESTPEGRKITGDARIKLSLLGATGEQTIQTIYLESADGMRPIRFSLSTRLNTNSPSEIDCRFSDDKLVVKSSLPGRAADLTLQWKPSYFFIGTDSDTEISRLIHNLGTAKSRAIRYYEPAAAGVKTGTFSRGEAAVVTIGGRKLVCDIYRLGDSADQAAFVVARDTSQVVETRAQGGKIVSRLADKRAMAGLQNYDALSRAFALSNVIFEDPEALTSVKLKVHGKIVAQDLSAASLQSPTQKFEGTVKDGVVDGILTILPVQYDGKNAPPFTGKPPSDTALAAFVKPEHNVECDDPEIERLAREITAGSKTQWDAAKKVAEWVHKNIHYTISGAGAKQCLAEKKGDCGPHTWLTIALCRAVGIPARITGGALYSEMLGGSFGQHYWTRVWMGPDGWIPIDSTSGEIGTLSPTHLTFWNLGGIASLNVKVLDYAPKQTAAAAPKGAERHSIAAKAGERERYLYKVEGKQIGEQSAECTSVSPGTAPTSDWKYTVKLDLTPLGQPVKATIDGRITVTDTDAPLKFSLRASADNRAQRVECAFEPKLVKITINMGGSDVKRTSPLMGSEVVGANNNMTVMSLAMRSLRLQPGGKATQRFFFADAMQPVTIKFAARPKTEKIQVMGRSVACVVVDAEPISEVMYVAQDSGALMRLEVPAQKAVIEKVE